jgi:hypothetical protein
MALFNAPVAAANTPGAATGNGLVDRLSRLHTVTATFKQETTYTPPPAFAEELKSAPPANGGPVLKREYLYNGLYIQRGTFSFLDGRAIYDVEYDPATVQRFESENMPFLRHSVQSFDLDRAESLVVHSKTGHAAGKISNSERLPDDFPIDIALGLRCAMEQVWLDPGRFADVQPVSLENGRMLFDIPDRSTSGIRHQWETDQGAQNAIVAYRRVDKSGFTSVDVTCSNFERYGEFMLPRLIESRWLWPSEKGSFVIRKIKVLVSQFVVDSPNNQPSQYHIAYPTNTVIEESRMNVPLYATTTRTFSDREIYEIARAKDVRLSARQRSLEGVSVLTWNIVAGVALSTMALLFWLFRGVRKRGTSTEQ